MAIFAKRTLARLHAELESLLPPEKQAELCARLASAPSFWPTNLRRRMVPEHLSRFTTREAIDRLAQRFGLPNTPGMQDWEWQVAYPARIPEFLAAYAMGGLSDDERFVLLEVLGANRRWRCCAATR
jgi:hypothetical protein